jgi:hypothetical protein
MEERIMISIKISTAEKLSKYKAIPNESWESLINRIITALEERE